MATTKQTTAPEAKGLGLTLGPSDPSSPLAYSESIWDKVSDAEGDGNLEGLLGNGTGAYRQHDINATIADKLAELSTDVGKVTSAGKYHKRPQSSDNSENTFDSLATLNAYQQDSTYTANVQVSDYALVKNYSYVETEDTEAQSGKTYYANAQGGALDQQPTEGYDISNSGYYEKVVSGYGRYHWSGSAWVLDYTLQKTLFEDAEWTAIGKGNIDNTLMQKLSSLPTATSLNDSLDSKQDVIDSTHKLSSDLVDDTDHTNKFVTDANKTAWNAKYDKPSNGIPSTDMTAAVQASLGLADGSEQAENRKTSIENADYSNEYYPTTKAVKDYVDNAIATESGTFIGTLESVEDLPTKSDRSELKNNDYAFVRAEDSEGNPEFNRYKFVDVPKTITVEGEVYEYVGLGDEGYPYPYQWRKTDTNNAYIYTESDTPTTSDYASNDSRATAGSASLDITAVAGPNWHYEYTLNNSSFTASQWSAIQSGIDAETSNWAKSYRSKAFHDLCTISEVTSGTPRTTNATFVVDDSDTATMEMIVSTKFNGAATACSVVAENWVNKGTGVYGKTVTSSYNESTGVITQGKIQNDTLTMSGSGVYAGLSHNFSVSKTQGYAYPFFYGYSTQLASLTEAEISSESITSTVANAVAQQASGITRVVGNADGAGSGKQAEGTPSATSRFFVIAKGNVTCNQLLNLDLVSKTIDVTVKDHANSSQTITLKNYKVYVTKRPFAASLQNAITVTVTKA